MCVIWKYAVDQFDAILFMQILYTHIFFKWTEM